MFVCPNCGANINFDPGKQLLHCDFCDTDLSPDAVIQKDDAEEHTYTESEADAPMLAEAINRFLDRIPETECQVFVRRYWYFQPVAQIAAACGCTESKVKSMLYRTRKKLYAALEKEALL